MLTCSADVIVAGGAGFIGSHLCERLLADGAEVLCLDNFSTGRPSHVAHLQVHPRFQLVEHDITRPLALSCQQIYNLACPAAPRHYQADPVQTLRTCVVGALNLLEEASRNAARILQASTSEVYGEPGVHPQPETYWGHVNPIGVRACYDEGKRAAETLFFDFHRQYGVQIKVARIFNTYGPRMAEQDGRVVPNFVVQALRGEPITIYGDGRQTRCFCYVDDLVAGLIGLMGSDEAVTGPVNLGSAEEITMLDLAEQIVALTGACSHLVFEPRPADDPSRRRPDASRARHLLGWQPRVPLPQGLARTIAHFEQRLCPAAAPRPTIPAAATLVHHFLPQPLAGD